MIETLHESFPNPRRRRPAGVVRVAACVLSISGASGLTAQGSATAPAERDSVVAEILKEREETKAWLAGKPTSYLAAVRRMDFEERRSLTVGRAPVNDLRIQDPTVFDRHLRVTVIGDSFRVETLDDGARFLVGTEPKRSALLPPSGIGLGRFHLRLSHQRFPALIVFDPGSPRLKTYKGLDYFPVDLRYRFVSSLMPDPTPDTVLILSTRGNTRRAVRAGWFEFRLDNRRLRLEATRLLEPGIGERDVGVFFKDATSGKETYPLGRYLDPVALPGGRYELDFNRAYNPACAFSEHYNCPIPPKANALPVAIRAGEKDSHYMEH